MLNWSEACSSRGQFTFTSSFDTGLMSGMMASGLKCPIEPSVRMVCISSERSYSSPGRTYSSRRITSSSTRWLPVIPTSLMVNCLPSNTLTSTSIESAPMIVSAGSICDMRYPLFW